MADTMNDAVDALMALLVDTGTTPIGELVALDVAAVLDYDPSNPADIQGPYTVTIFREQTDENDYILTLRVYGSLKANPTTAQRGCWAVADVVDGLIGSAAGAPNWISSIDIEAGTHVVSVTVSWPRENWV